eukprot:3837520-Amphidinium_carterae.1
MSALGVCLEGSTRSTTRAHVPHSCSRKWLREHRTGWWPSSCSRGKVGRADEVDRSTHAATRR